ncbi:MAG: hypothetical protein K8R69_04400, partial [Deltaproteobacteria bacterium]|nr:hypothetical protein [Deltaproteobacteria bacterium]
RTGNDFSLYKKSTVYRRVERRMGLHQIERIAHYVHYLRENPQEVELLFKELLIGVTSFFRDPASWNSLQTQVLPQLLAAYPAGATLRAWVAGCSTGEEAYTLAMAFREVQQKQKPAGRFALQIFATDLDPDAIAKARRAVYPANIVADVTAERLKRFFVEEGEGYRVGKEIREISIDAMQALQAYAWVGNVRELENILERCCVLLSGDVIHAKDLPAPLLASSFYLGDQEEVDLSRFSYKEAKLKALCSFNKSYLHHLLKQTDGNISLASDRAGMDRSNFKKIIRKYEVDIREFKKG